MQPADIALALRRRSPWEATDLGFSMMQRWWRPVYATHAVVLGLVARPVVGERLLDQVGAGHASGGGRRDGGGQREQGEGEPVHLCLSRRARRRLGLSPPAGHPAAGVG